MSNDKSKGSSFVAKDMIGQMRMAGCLVIKEAFVHGSGERVPSCHYELVHVLNGLMKLDGFWLLWWHILKSWCFGC